MFLFKLMVTFVKMRSSLWCQSNQFVLLSFTIFNESIYSHSNSGLDVCNFVWV